MFIYQFVDPDQGVECSLKKAGKRTGGYDFKIGDSDNYCILVSEVQGNFMCSLPAFPVFLLVFR